MSIVFVLAALFGQQALPTVDEIVAKIEEKNQGLGPFEAEVLEELDGYGTISRGRLWGDGKTFVAWDIVMSPNYRGAQLFLSMYAERAESAYKMAEVGEGSWRSAAAKGNIVMMDVDASYFARRLIFDATLMPRAFLKGTWEVREYKEGDVIGYSLTTNIQCRMEPEGKARLTYFVSSADWRIHGVELGTEEPYRIEVSEFRELGGVKLPVIMGEEDVIRLSGLRPVAEVTRPYWAKMSDLPQLMPDTAEELWRTVEKEPSFTNRFNLTHAMAFPWLFGLSDNLLEQFKKVLQEECAKRQDCPSFNEALALIHWELGEKEEFLRVARSSGSPLLALLLAESAEVEGRLEEALRFVESMPASGYYTVLRQEMSDRLRLRLCKDVDAFVAMTAAALERTRLEALEPVPWSHSIFGTKDSPGIFNEKHDAYCLEAISRCKDDRIRVLVARRWLKQGEFAAADEQYADLPIELLKGLGEEPAEVIKHSGGALPRLAMRMASEHPDEVLFLAGALLGVLDSSDVLRAEEFAGRITDRLKAMEVGESLPNDVGAVVAKAAMRLAESGGETAPRLLKASLARLPQDQDYRKGYGSDLTPEHIEGIQRVGRDAVGQYDLMRSIPIMDEVLLNDLKIDRSAFRTYVRKWLSSGSAQRNAYETLAMLVRETWNWQERKFAPDADDDVRLLEKYSEQFPTAWGAFETLGDYAFTNDRPAEAGPWYARALLSRLDEGRRGLHVEQIWDLSEDVRWGIDHDPSLKSAVAFSQAGDCAGGLSLFERVRTHPRVKEWDRAEEHLLDMLFVLDPERCLREAVASDAKRPGTEEPILLRVLRRGKRWVEAFAWCLGVNCSETQEMRILALLSLTQEMAPRTELAPELLASVNDEARSKMKAIVAQFAEWSRGDVFARSAVAAHELAVAVRGTEQIDGDVIDSLLDLARRLGAGGRRDEAWALVDALAASKLGGDRIGPLLLELAAGDKKTLYEHFRLHSIESSSWRPCGLSAEDVLSFALEAAQTPEGLLQDFRYVAKYVQAVPRERADLGTILRKGVERFPDDHGLWEALGDDAYAGGRYSEALDAFIQASSRPDWDERHGRWEEKESNKYHPLLPLSYKMALAAQAAGEKEKGGEALRAYYHRLIKGRGSTGTCQRWSRTYDHHFYESFAASFEFLGESSSVRGIAARYLPTVAQEATRAVGDDPPWAPQFYAESLLLALRLIELYEREGNESFAWVVSQSVQEEGIQNHRGDEAFKVSIDRLQKSRERLGDQSEELMAWFLERVPEMGKSDVKEADRLVTVLRISGLEERDIAVRALTRLARAAPLALKAHLNDADVEVRSRVQTALLPVAKEAALRAILEEGKGW